MKPDDTASPPAHDEPVGIHTEPAPFEPGYQPGSVPEITVPDLAPDAVGVSAEVLAEAQIPTLTDQVQDETPQIADATEPVEQADAQEPELAQSTQEQEPRADTWVEQIQVRMSKLSGDIQTLNDRLDRLEQRAKTKA